MDHGRWGWQSDKTKAEHTLLKPRTVVVDLVARVFQAALGHFPPRSGLAALRLGSACYRERAADVLR